MHGSLNVKWMQKERFISTEIQADLKIDSDISKFFKKEFLNFPLTKKKEEKKKENVITFIPLNGIDHNYSACRISICICFSSMSVMQDSQCFLCKFWWIEPD